jgi:hypothetical protein
MADAGSALGVSSAEGQTMKPIWVRAALLSCAALATGPAIANHAWNNYHWNRSGDQVTAPVGDNVSSQWDIYLQVAVNGGAGNPGWNNSGVIQSPLVGGSALNPKTCKPVAGTIQVCNARYGNNGWLGIAQIWLSGGHITQGVTKLNDTYFNTPTYNTAAWRRLVTCQEVGHDYGLGHVNENFNPPNTGSCMDYTNDPDGGGAYGPTNEYPNQHDFDQLGAIYGHADATNFAVRNVGQSNQGAVSEEAGGDTPAEWGRAIHFDGKGRPDVFEKQVGPGRKKVTHVFWAIGEGPNGKHHDEH